MRSSSAQGEGRFEDIAVGREENSRQRIAEAKKQRQGGDPLDGMVDVFAQFLMDRCVAREDSYCSFVLHRKWEKTY